MSANPGSADRAQHQSRIAGGAFGILDRSCASAAGGTCRDEGRPDHSTTPPAGRTKGWVFRKALDSRFFGWPAAAWG